MKELRIRFCPNCASNEIKLVIGGKIGLWECKKCGFRGAIFPEKIIKFKEKNVNRKIIKNKTR